MTSLAGSLNLRLQPFHSADGGPRGGIICNRRDWRFFIDRLGEDVGHRSQFISGHPLCVAIDDAVAGTHRTALSEESVSNQDVGTVLPISRKLRGEAASLDRREIIHGRLLTTSDAKNQNKQHFTHFNPPFSRGQFSTIAA